MQKTGYLFSKNENFCLNFVMLTCYFRYDSTILSLKMICIRISKMFVPILSLYPVKYRIII